MQFLNDMTKLDSRPTILAGKKFGHVQYSQHIPRQISYRISSSGSIFWARTRNVPFYFGIAIRLILRIHLEERHCHRPHNTAVSQLSTSC